MVRRFSAFVIFPLFAYCREGPFRVTLWGRQVLYLTLGYLRSREMKLCTCSISNNSRELHFLYGPWSKIAATMNFELCQMLAFFLFLFLKKEINLEDNADVKTIF